MNFLYKLWRVFVYTLKDIKYTLSELFYENRHGLFGLLQWFIVLVCLFFNILMAATILVTADSNYAPLYAISSFIGLVILEISVGAIIIHMIYNWKEVE